MKIEKKRDKISNINYGDVIFEIDEFGAIESDNPILVLNTETSSDKNDDVVFVASLNDGRIYTLDLDTIVEIADVSLIIKSL